MKTLNKNNKKAYYLGTIIKLKKNIATIKIEDYNVLIKSYIKHKNKLINNINIGDVVLIYYQSQKNIFGRKIFYIDKKINKTNPSYFIKSINYKEIIESMMRYMIFNHKSKIILYDDGNNKICINSYYLNNYNNPDIKIFDIFINNILIMNCKCDSLSFNNFIYNFKHKIPNKIYESIINYMIDK